MNGNRILVLAGVGLVALAGIVIGARALVLWIMAGGIDRAWAVIATVLLPVCLWLGWWFGHTEARGRLAGIDQAVDKVMGAASKAVDLRVVSVRKTREVLATDQAPVVILPDPGSDFHMRPQLPSGDTVDL